MFKKSVVISYVLMVFLMNFCKPVIEGTYNLVSPEGLLFLGFADKHGSTEGLTEREELILQYLKLMIDQDIPLTIVLESDTLIPPANYKETHAFCTNIKQVCSFFEIFLQLSSYLEEKKPANICLVAGDCRFPRSLHVTIDDLSQYWDKKIVELNYIVKAIDKVPSDCLFRRNLILRWKILFFDKKNNLMSALKKLKNSTGISAQGYIAATDLIEFMIGAEAQFADCMFLYQIITAPKPVVFYAGAAHVQNVVTILQSWGYAQGSVPVECDMAVLEAEYEELAKSFELLASEHGVYERRHSQE